MEPSREADPVRRQALVIIDASGQPGLDMPSLARVQALHRIVDHVVLAPVATETPPALPDLGPVEFFQPPIYASIEEILRRHRHVFDVIVLQGADLALRYGGLIRHLLPRARLLMSVNGLASAAMDDRAAIDMQPELGQAARTLATCEGFATFMVDAVLASSARESEMLRGHGCATRIEITAWPVVPRPRSVDVAATQGVAMLGGHWPDAMLDAAEWLIGQVMTLVWSRDPTIICWLADPAPFGGDANPVAETGARSCGVCGQPGCDRAFRMRPGSPWRRSASARACNQRSWPASPRAFRASCIGPRRMGWICAARCKAWYVPMNCVWRRLFWHCMRIWIG